MEWQTLGTLQTNREYTYTPIVSGNLFKLKHITEAINREQLKIIIRQAIEQPDGIALFDYKLINCKDLNEILFFKTLRIEGNRKLAIKRADNLDTIWNIEIEELNIVDEEFDLPITYSDIVQLEQQISLLRDELQLKALEINLLDHTNNNNNPHQVTAIQVGAEPLGTATLTVLNHEDAFRHLPATNTEDGFFTAANKIKLDNIELGATANNIDSYLLSRTNHTGSQNISTIIGLQLALDSKEPNIGILPINKGGTNSNIRNFVDLSSDEEINSVKTFLKSPIVPNAISNNQVAAFGQINAVTVGHTSAIWNANRLQGTFVSFGTLENNQLLTYIQSSNSWRSATFNDAIHGSRGGGDLHTIATTTTSGFISSVDIIKLNGIAPNATANSSDSFLLNRSNHTNTQPINTITNLQSILDSKETAGSAISAVTTHESTVNHPIATSTSKGMISVSDKNKLDGISNNATANSSDTYLLDRTNHTGTQLITTITNLQTILDSKEPVINVLPINRGGTGSSTRNFVDLTSNETITGRKDFSSGNLNLTNPTSNLIAYNGNGVAVPSFTNRSLGTKVVLFPSISSTVVDYAIGIASGILWYSIPQFNNSNKYSWYAGTTEIASLRGDGLMSLQRLTVALVNAWIAPTLVNTWENFGSPQATAGYRKLPDGTVEFKGLIKKATNFVIGETIFNVPVGFRPLEHRLFSCISNNGVGQLQVLSNGTVVVYFGSNVWFSLEGIKFVAEQ